MLIAIGNSIGKESNNNDQNVSITRPLKYNVMEMHKENTKLENVYKELSYELLTSKEVDNLIIEIDTLINIELINRCHFEYSLSNNNLLTTILSAVT